MWQKGSQKKLTKVKKRIQKYGITVYNENLDALGRHPHVIQCAVTQNVPEGSTPDVTNTTSVHYKYRMNGNVLKESN